jgi:hypothetical protein
MKIKSRRNLAIALYEAPVSLNDISRNLTKVVDLWIRRGEVVIHQDKLKLNKI